MKNGCREIGAAILTACTVLPKVSTVYVCHVAGLIVRESASKIKPMRTTNSNDIVHQIHLIGRYICSVAHYMVGEVF